MAVVRVDALCECEGCRKSFGVELELATDLKTCFSSDFDGLVREEIRSGDGVYYTSIVRGKQTIDRVSLNYKPTIQAGLMLCDVCSKKCDDLPIEGDLTLEQVEQAIRGTLEDEEDED